MSISRTRTISSWSSAKTASLITSDVDQNYLSAFFVAFGGKIRMEGGVHARGNEKKKGGGGGRGGVGVVIVGIEGKG